MLLKLDDGDIDQHIRRTFQVCYLNSGCRVQLRFRLKSTRRLKPKPYNARNLFQLSVIKRIISFKQGQEQEDTDSTVSVKIHLECKATFADEYVDTCGCTV